ncbi:GAF domain-containing protein [Fulvivirga maritima]|uniref:GAF domain-containing protein n=1 Tax=Fulvivirga maritima TaxID=2904247 RepID=UPI001F1B4BFF|nr:GAF domain-containing protein [Fulvivirga maritima]UII29334.1 GAF domain-containing protein [Fulvivirga maritima]
MKVKFRKLNIALIALYVAGIILTTYVLFHLQDDLITDGALDLSKLSTSQPIFLKLYAVAGITLLVGLGSLVLALSSSNQEVIYVDRKKDSKSDNNSDNNDYSDDDSHSLDLNTIKTILAQETDEGRLAKELLVEVCKQMDAGLGAVYKATEIDGSRKLSLKASYALPMAESKSLDFEFGEGLIGQVATEQKTILIDDIPEGYIKIMSGLGSASPTHLLITPIIHKDKLYGVAEIASFTSLGKTEERMVNETFRQFTQALDVLESESKKTYQLKTSGSKSDSSKGNTQE